MCPAPLRHSVPLAVLVALAAASVSSLHAQRSAPAAPVRQNIVFIISDDHRWDGLGAAGNPNVITPNLDRLAREGMYFSQATMHVAQCSPARAQLLTGLPPHRNGWYSNQYQREDVRNPRGFHSLPRLPQLLADAGYRTVLVGKWHLTAEPWDIGFTDVRRWLPGGGGAYQDLPLAHGQSRETKPVAGFAQDAFTASALEFLTSPAAREEPFLLWLAYTAPHAPHQPNPERISALYSQKTTAALAPPMFKGTGESPRRDWRTYNEAISFLDEQVGRVMTTLRDRGLAQTTTVVFLGDNGFMMGNRAWDGKVLPYEDSIRVPMIVWRAGLKTAGANAAPVSSLDLPPTFLRWAGLPPQKDWVGRDLSTLLDRGADASFTHAVSEFADDRSEQFGQYAYRLIRTPEHKLILWQRKDKPDELYELTKDPNEETNLAGQRAVADVEQRLRGELDEWMTRTRDEFPRR